jgi:hypothetical protein
LSRRGSMPVPLFDKVNDALTKLHRKWLTHH